MISSPIKPQAFHPLPIRVYPRKGVNPCLPPSGGLSVSIGGFLSTSFPLQSPILPPCPLCPLCLIPASFPLPQPPVFSTPYKRVRISLKTSTFKSLYFQAVAHSLSLFSCKSFIYNHVSKTTGGYTPKLSDFGIFGSPAPRRAILPDQSNRSKMRTRPIARSSIIPSFGYTHRIRSSIQ